MSAKKNHPTPNDQNKGITLLDLEATPTEAAQVFGGRTDSQGTGSKGAGSGIGDSWSAADFWYWAVTSRW